MQSPDLVVAILAAGASRRLGHAKQLVAIDGEPLLRRQCRCALSAKIGDVVVILGSNADRHRAVIANLPVEVRVNDEWREGLAATLRCAVDVAASHQAALLVLPCDLYRIVPEDLRALRDAWRLSPSTPCATRVGRWAGPPAILPIQYHGHVLELRGDIGARSLLAHATAIVNPRAIFDLDSADDLRIAEAWTDRRSA